MTTRTETVTGNGAGNATTKVLRVLDALGHQDRLADIARSTGLPKTTVHRILQALVAEDFASVDHRGGYAPGGRLLGLAGRTLGRADVVAGADPALRRLQQGSGATVHLAVRVGDEAVYVRKLEADKPYRMVSRIGMAVPLHCTSIGKAILSALPESEVRAIVARTGLPARTTHTHTTADELLADLTVAGERGWALDQEENELGVVCVGGPVRDHTGHVTAAVSVSQLRSDPEAMPVDRLGAQVAAAAREVSSGLGAPG